MGEHCLRGLALGWRERARERRLEGAANRALVADFQLHTQGGEQSAELLLAAAREGEVAAGLLEAGDDARDPRGREAHPLLFEEQRVREHREPAQRIHEPSRDPLDLHVNPVGERRAHPLRQRSLSKAVRE